MGSKFNILLVLIIILLASSCLFTQSDNDLEELNLKGPVKKLTEHSYGGVKKFGKIEPDYNDKYGSDIYEFNNEGFKLSETSYLDDDILLFKTSFKYEDGFLIEENELDSNDNLKGKVIYHYNDEGKKVESNIYNSDGELSSKKVYRYNSNGIKKGWSEYSNSKRVFQKFIRRSHNDTTIIEYNNFKESIFEDHYFIREKGKLIKSIEYLRGVANVSSIETYFDEDGNKKYVTSYNKGEVKSTKEFTYTDFDEYGNWKECIVKTNNSLTVKQREISYFDSVYYSLVNSIPLIL